MQFKITMRKPLNVKPYKSLNARLNYYQWYWMALLIITLWDALSFAWACVDDVRMRHQRNIVRQPTGKDYKWKMREWEPN